MSNYLAWLDNENLEAAVVQLLTKAQEAKAQAKVRSIKNVIDPFSSLVSAATYEISEVTGLEGIRESTSASMGISNAVGGFHQTVLGKVAQFKNHDAGYDLESSRRKILAEVKNKHNTMNASNKEKVINELDTAIRQKPKGWTAYLVLIIPSSPKRYKKKLTKREVYEVDGASFYEIATGHKNALHELYHAVEKITMARKAKAFANREVLDECKSALDRGIPK